MILQYLVYFLSLSLGCSVLAEGVRLDSDDHTEEVRLEADDYTQEASWIAFDRGVTVYDFGLQKEDSSQLTALLLELGMTKIPTRAIIKRLDGPFPVKRINLYRGTKLLAQLYLNPVNLGTQDDEIILAKHKVDRVRSPMGCFDLIPSSVGQAGDCSNVQREILVSMVSLDSVTMNTMTLISRRSDGQEIATTFSVTEKSRLARCRATMQPTMRPTVQPKS